MTGITTNPEFHTYAARLHAACAERGLAGKLATGTWHTPRQPREDDRGLYRGHARRSTPTAVTTPRRGIGRSA